MASRLSIEEERLKVGQVKKITSSNGKKIDFHSWRESPILSMCFPTVILMAVFYINICYSHKYEIAKHQKYKLLTGKWYI